MFSNRNLVFRQIKNSYFSLISAFILSQVNLKLVILVYTEQRIQATMYQTRRVIIIPTIISGDKDPIEELDKYPKDLELVVLKDFEWKVIEKAV